MTETEIIKETTTSTLHIFLRADGIVVTEEIEDFLNDTSVEMAREIMEAIAEICGNEKRPILARIGNRPVSREERAFYMKQKQMPVTKVAMMVKNPFQKMLANFLIGLNKVPFEAKLFTDEEKAVAWLKEGL